MKDLEVETLINQENLLDSNYVPLHLVVLDDNKDNFHNYKCPNLKPMVRDDIIPDLLDMFHDANEAGYGIIVDSGYRSYSYQKQILEDKIKQMGIEKAYQLVALPGASEHQSGLCFDVAYFYDGVYSDNVVEDDKEVKWLMSHSYQYGFVLRYPKGKEEITGYSFEPWHYRYVGKRLAKILYDNDETLEEYYYKKKVRVK